jgi:hypothetical protein
VIGRRAPRRPPSAVIATITATTPGGPAVSSPEQPRQLGQWAEVAAERGRQSPQKPNGAGQHGPASVGKSTEVPWPGTDRMTTTPGRPGKPCGGYFASSHSLVMTMTREAASAVTTAHVTTVTGEALAASPLTPQAAWRWTTKGGILISTASAPGPQAQCPGGHGTVGTRRDRDVDRPARGAVPGAATDLRY